MDSKNMIMS